MSNPEQSLSESRTPGQQQGKAARSPTSSSQGGQKPGQQQQGGQKPDQQHQGGQQKPGQGGKAARPSKSGCRLGGPHR